MPPDPAVIKPYWLYRLAAWVAIVAGAVFIAAVIFFSGAILTHHGHHGHHFHHKMHHAMFHPGGMHRGPGGGPGAGTPGPGQPPQSVLPSTAPAHP